ncbi:hypothetical protein U1Q18_013929 [Sarracenia purpurea var. burkii]
MACRILNVCFFLFGVAGLTPNLVILTDADISFGFVSSLLLMSSLLSMGVFLGIGGIAARVSELSSPGLYSRVMCCSSWVLAPVGWMDQPGSCDIMQCLVVWSVGYAAFLRDLSCPLRILCSDGTDSCYRLILLSRCGLGVYMLLDSELDADSSALGDVACIPLALVAAMV